MVSPQKFSMIFIGEKTRKFLGRREEGPGKEGGEAAYSTTQQSQLNRSSVLNHTVVRGQAKPPTQPRSGTEYGQSKENPSEIRPCIPHRSGNSQPAKRSYHRRAHWKTNTSVHSLYHVTPDH